MANQYDISVVISTYNRSALLATALESILAQVAPDVSYEVTVVDNNSSDQTRLVVESLASKSPVNLQYVFEARQGVSYARNSGIRKASAPITAFCDDDVRVSRDWIATLKRAFDEHPEVECVGGRVLPRWESDPPSWLTAEHWAPIALQDYGETPFYINQCNRLCLLSANFAFRSEVFGRIGSFAPELQRVRDGVGSMEDLELLTRFWKSNGQALYIPSLIVEADVPNERMSKRYHRRWHLGHGHFYALLRSEEIEYSEAGRFYDVPAHLYRQAAVDLFQWVRSLGAGKGARAFTRETRLCYFAGFFRTRRAGYLADHSRSARSRIASVAKSLIRRLWKA